MVKTMELTHLEQSWQQRVGADGLLLLRKPELHILTLNKDKPVALESGHKGKPREQAVEDNFLLRKAWVKTLLLHKY